MFAFANAASIDPVKTGIDPEKNEKTESMKKEFVILQLESKKLNSTKEVGCTISCNNVVGGVIIVATSGNWFTGCARAARNCKAELDRLTN